MLRNGSQINVGPDVLDEQVLGEEDVEIQSLEGQDNSAVGSLYQEGRCRLK